MLLNFSNTATQRGDGEWDIDESSPRHFSSGCLLTKAGVIERVEGNCRPDRGGDGGFGREPALGQGYG